MGLESIRWMLLIGAIWMPYPFCKVQSASEWVNRSGFIRGESVVLIEVERVRIDASFAI